MAMARGERVEGREVVVEVLKLAWERVHTACASMSCIRSMSVR
jgi:hypothetical protein